MTNFLIPVAALFILGSAASAAAATPAPTSAQRGTAILHACTAEAPRFCPDDLSSGRNLAICLRPYRSSLSLACRRAVTATRS